MLKIDIGMDDAIVLEKVRLHNWYTYWDRTIPFGESTIITGATGSGKTAMNDAIMYALTNDHYGFNQASGNKFKTDGREEKRTLFSYVRGFTGDESEPYFRPDGEVTGIIMLEFRDRLYKRSFVTVHTIRSAKPDQKTTVTTRHLLYNDEMDFHVEDIVCTDEEGCDFLENGIRVHTDGKNVPLTRYRCRSLGHYEDSMARLFGEDFNYEAFKKNMARTFAYAPNQRVEEFMKEVIFGPREIDVDDTAHVLEKSNEVSKTILENNEKEKHYEEIKKNIEEYQREQYLDSVSGYAQTYAQIEYLKDDIAEKEKKSAEIRNRLTAVEKALADADAAKEAASKTCYAMRMQKEDMERNFGLQEIRNQLREAKAALSKQTEAREELDKYVEITMDAMGIDTELDTALKEFKACLDVDTDHVALLNQMLSAANSAAERFGQEAYAAYAKGKQEKEKAEDLFKQEQALSVSGVSPHIEKFRQELIRKAEEERIPDFRVYTFADVIKTVDEDWRGCVETLLGRDRMALLCAPEHYQFIKRRMDAAQRRGVRDIVLIDSVAVDRALADKGAIDNSLAKKVGTDNIFARRFLDFRLGRTICCDNMDDLEQYSRSCTKEGLFYNGYSLRSLDFRPDTYCLGAEMIRLRKKRLHTEAVKHEQNAEQAERDMSVATYRKTKANACLYDRAALIVDARVAEKRLYKNCRTLEEKLEKLGSDVTFVSLTQQLVEAKKEEEAAKTRFLELNGQASLLKAQKAEYDGGENEAGSILNDKKRLKEQSDFFNALPEETRSAARREYASKDKTSIKRRTVQWDIHKLRAQEAIGKFRNSVANLEIHFPGEGRGTEDADFPYYGERLQTLRNDNSGRLVTELENYRERFRQSIKDNIALRLYSNIIACQEEKKSLNAVLSKTSFSGDSYRIVVRKTQNPDFVERYRLIMELGRQMTSETYAGELDIKADRMLEELAGKIITYVQEKDPDKRQKNLEKVLDYRNYLEFDVEKNKGDGRWISLKKKLGSDSGGEAQNAYYVILAAAWASLYEKHGLRLVCVDEAFDKIDETRRGDVARFFRKFGFQCVWTTPYPAPFVEQADMLISVMTTEDRLNTFVHAHKLEKKSADYFFYQEKAKEKTQLMV